MPRKIEISHRTIVFIFLFLCGVGFLYLIRDLLMQLFVAVVIMAVLNPLVSKLSRWRIPRGIAVVLVYITVIGAFAGAVAGIIPPLVDQTTSLVNDFPILVSRLGWDSYIGPQVVGQMFGELSKLPGEAVKIGVSVVSNVLTMLTVLIFSFYLLLMRNKLDTQLAFLFGDNKRKEIARILDIIETKLGGWLRGELLLMLLVGFLTYIGLALIGIPFAVPLAIMAGLLEIVPMLGPIVAAVPATIIGLSISPTMGLAAAALAFAVQQLENYVFVPKIMEKSTGVSPIITLLALSIGFRLAGVAGAVISMPVVLALSIIAKEYFFNKS
jgi:predicted PurR-regulated permease PerM